MVWSLSDSPTNQESNREYCNNLLDTILKKQNRIERMKAADELLEIFNRCSKNLIPGNSKINRDHVKDNFDPELIFLGDENGGIWEQTLYSEKVFKLFNEILKTLNIDTL